MNKTTKLIKPLKIGPIKLKNNILLAPMVDVTDSAYRQICLKQGASLTYTPMLYTSQIINENPKTQKLMQFTKSEKPIGIQITGSDLKEYKLCIPYLKHYDVIDINCGCPSHKLINSKAGSYLLKNPKKIAEIIKLLKSAFPKKAITAKIRLGFKTNNVLKICKAIERAGADAITIHARLAVQSNKTPADWNEIKKIKSLVPIPIIANGDVFSGKDAISLLKTTNCDGIMIARAAIGNPLIFKQILNYEKKLSENPSNPKEKIKSFLEYIHLSKKEKTSDLARIKYLGSSFISGFQGAPSKRAEFSKLKSIKEIELFIKNIIKSL